MSKLSKHFPLIKMEVEEEAISVEEEEVLVFNNKNIKIQMWVSRHLQIEEEGEDVLLLQMLNVIIVTRKVISRSTAEKELKMRKIKNQALFMRKKMRHFFSQAACKSQLSMMFGM